MILASDRISELEKWLDNWDDDIKTRFPDGRCTCEACCFSREIGITTREITSTRLKMIMRKALTLYDRFGQCDLDLLKELCPKEIGGTDG